MAEHKMTVIDGIRYRPEDVPEQAETGRDEQEGGAVVTHKARRPARRAKGGKDDASG